MTIINETRMKSIILEIDALQQKLFKATSTEQVFIRGDMQKLFALLGELYYTELEFQEFQS